MPDPDRPSAAPLSESEADRLSERFTASWDEPEPPTLEPQTLPVAPPPVPHKAKPTLVGIAPIVVVGGSPSSPPAGRPTASAAPPLHHPSASPSIAQARAMPSDVPTAPMPPVAVIESPTAASALGQPHPAPAPLLSPAASAEPALGLGAGAPKPLPTPPSAPPAPTSSPDSIPPSSPVATGLTTPSKPYVPKDDPSTPAVVISDAVPTGGAKLDRARIAETLPAQTRSAPLASAAPVGSAPFAASSGAASLNRALDDTHPPARKRASKLPLILGASAVVAVGLVAAMKLGVGGASAVRDVPAPQALSPATAAPAAVTRTPPEAAPVTPSEATPPAKEAAAVASEPAPQPEPIAAPTPQATKAAPKRSFAAATPKRSATKAEGRAPAPAGGPAQAKPAKGVIVRETPF